MRIVIAEDDPLLREGLALLLRAEGLDVVATAGTPDEALAAIDEHKPDVAVLDVRMPPTHTDEGIVAAVEARRRMGPASPSSCCPRTSSSPSPPSCSPAA